MVLRILSPKWFYGYDSLFELVSIIAVVLIAILSIRAYKFTKNKSYKYLGYSFFLIGLSFIVKIGTNLLAYFEPLIKTRIGFLVTTTYNVQKISMIYYTGYFFYRLTILVGFLIILLLALKVKDKKEIALFSFFILITTFFSNQAYFIFHMTCAFMLIFIYLYFFHNWQKRKTESALTISVAFFIILLSQAVFIFVLIDKSIYVIGEIFQLLGYLMLLYTYLLVLKK